MIPASRQIVPGAGMNKAGTYAVVITQYGRVADGCSAQSLGPVLHAQVRLTLGFKVDFC